MGKRRSRRKPKGVYRLKGSMEKDGRIAVLHLISGLEIGGAERMLLLSARYHDRKAFRFLVVSLMSGGPLADSIRKEGVDVREMGQKRGRFSPCCFRKLFRIIREFSPDILQGHLFHSDMLVRFFGVFLPGSVVISTRHSEKDSLVRRIAYALTSPLNGATLVFSKPVSDYARKDDPLRRPLRLATYGIDLERPVTDRGKTRFGLDIPQDVFLWITVGRLTRPKGLFHLLEAFRDLTQNPDLKPFLLIVGEGEDRPSLIRKAQELGLTGKIRFAGRRSDVPDLLAASDGFVLSSLWEGGPLVVLEAMAAGLPVVATRVGDVPSMVQEGKTGLVVEGGESRALALAMKKIMDLGAESIFWGEAGRERVMENFSFEKTQRSVETIYRELVGRKPEGAAKA